MAKSANPQMDWPPAFNLTCLELWEPKSPEYDHSKDSGGSCYWVWRKWGRIGALRTQGPAARSKSVKDGRKMVARARQNRRSQHSQQLSEFKGFLDKPNKHDWRVWRLARDELLRHQVLCVFWYENQGTRVLTPTTQAIWQPMYVAEGVLS